jgi:hypothetical protein
LNFIPYFWNEKDGEKQSSHLKPLYFDAKQNSSIAISILSSSLFYWWFIILSDCRDFNIREIDEFPVDLGKMQNEIKASLEKLSMECQKDIKKNTIRKECYYQATGKVIYDEFRLKKSQPVFNEIDKVLAKHYGFTDEELDFIINYDIKYRMGDELQEEE